MNVCPSNEAFTHAVHAAGGSEWGVSVELLPDGSYGVRFLRTSKPREKGDELTCIDARQIALYGDARIVELCELLALIQFWRVGKLVSTLPLPGFPLEGPIPVFCVEKVTPNHWRWVRLDPESALVVPEEKFDFCGLLI